MKQKEGKIPDLNIEKINIKGIKTWYIIREVKSWRNERGKILRRVEAKCTCGNTKIIRMDRLYSKPCIRCVDKEITIRKQHIRNKIDRSNDTEYFLKTKILSVYKGIKKRCFNIKSKDYKNYGGRGILIDKSFNTFDKFYKWMLEEGYTIDSKLEIDRKDNNGNYSAENCRLITRAENTRNRRNTVMNWDYIYKIRYGEWKELSAKEISQIVGCTVVTIYCVRSGKTWK